MFEYFLQAATLGFWASAQPGPFQAFLITHTLRVGGRHAIPAAWAPVLAEAPIIGLALLVLTQVPPLLLRGLHLAGGLLLFWLAWSTLRRGTARSASAGSVDERGIGPAERTAPGLVHAIVAGLSVPGPWLGWTLICGPLLVEAWRTSSGSAASFLFGFYGALCGTNTALVLLVSRARSLGPRASRAITILTAGALLVLGARQVWKGALGVLPGV